MKTVIGITTYNGAARVDNLLRSIEMRTSIDSEVAIVLVDDGSPNRAATAGVAEFWARRLPVQFIQHETNRGISAGWNTATRAVSAKNVVLINDDVIVSKNWLDTILYVLDNSPMVGVVGANWHAFLAEDVDGLLASPDSDKNVIPRDPVTKAQDPSRRRFEDNNPGRVMAPTGQLFAFRRDDYEAIGGFDEAYKSFYEEICFGTAMARWGKIGVQLNEPFNFHQWSATFGSSPELQAGSRMQTSHEHYCNKWNVPAEYRSHPFDYTNPKHLGAIGDVPIKFLRRSGPGQGVLRTDGAFIES